ncbi:MAG: hypothetical protein HND52_01820 [Ignavibacteriae bacterium]|nr:hypothetical protein [Ignavibacteriota bacterium]NOG96688.1 hypothetical protein [Ignavibacteriota bacterium]
MSAHFQVRPRFKFLVKDSSVEILKKFKEKIGSTSSGVTGWVADRTAHVQVVEETKHIWSPQLTVYTEEVEEGTEVRCVIGPGSTVWTTFLFIYAVLGLAAMVGLFWGLSQVTLGHTPHAFWLIGIAAVLTGGVVYLAKVGQKLSAGQMKILNEFVVEVVGEGAEIIE